MTNVPCPTHAARGHCWHRLGRKDEVTAKKGSEKEIASFLYETGLLQFSRNVRVFLEKWLAQTRSHTCHWGRHLVALQGDQSFPGTLEAFPWLQQKCSAGLRPKRVNPSFLLKGWLQHFVSGGGNGAMLGLSVPIPHQGRGALGSDPKSLPSTQELLIPL